MRRSILSLGPALKQHMDSFEVIQHLFCFNFWVILKYKKFRVQVRTCLLNWLSRRSNVDNCEDTTESERVCLLDGAGFGVWTTV